MDVPFVPEDVPSDLAAPPGGCSGAFSIENLDGTPAVAPLESADHVFRQDALAHYELELKPEDWEWLKVHALEEIYVPANLVYEGLRYVNIGVRFKGAWSTLEGCFDAQGKQICPKLSMKLRFNKYDSCGRFYGLRRLVFNANAHDVTHMRERLMYNLMAKVGITSSRASHATLSVNGEPASLFTLVEPVDKAWLETRFDDPEGNLYKQIWPVHTDPTIYVQALRTNESQKNVDDMLAFAQALADLWVEAYSDELDPHVDLSTIAKMAAFARATGDDDGFLRFWCTDMFSVCENHNYYWYGQPEKPFVLLPWDQDITFYGYKEPHEISLDWWKRPTDCSPVPLYVFEGITDPDPSDFELVLPPQCDDLLYIAVQHHSDVYLDTMEQIVVGLAQTIDEFSAIRSQIEGPLKKDPALGFTMGEWNVETDWFLKKLGQQKEAIEQMLAQTDDKER